jgi:hypothetical protein
MAIGKITGQMLKDNLERSGVDLAFETDLIYLDVNNGRVGIKTTTPTHELTVNGTLRSTNYEVSGTANIADITISGNTIESNTSTLALTASGTNAAVYNARLVVDDLELEGNVVRTTTTNTDIEIQPNGSGEMKVYGNATVYGDLHATGTITADGNLQLGDANTDSITFNADITSNIIPDADDTYTLGESGKRWADVWVNRLNAGTITADEILAGGINLIQTQGQLWYVSANGDDSNSGSHQNDTFGTVKYALSQATVGDTVFIYPGTYEEEFPLTVPAGVSVKGLGIRSVKITPTTATQYNDAFLLNGETTVEDLTVADFFSGGNYFTVTSASAGSTTFNVGTTTFAHTYVSGGTINISGTDYAITGATYDYTTGITTVTHAGPDATGLEIFLSGLIFSCNGGTRTFPDNGYAFRFAPDAVVTTRSPYVRNITVLTRGSVTSTSDPLGYDAGDAGKGAYVDGAYVGASSKEASMLFHSVTFITPGVDALTMTNGVRVEWLNSFTYYATKGLYAYASNDGFAGDGKTRVKISSVTGTWNISDTLTYYDTDGSTILATGTIEDIDGEYYIIDGYVPGFETITDRQSKTVSAVGNAQLSTTQKKFGSASLYLDGTGDYANVSSNPDFGFDTGDFCIEAWVYPTTTGTYREIFDLRSSAGDTGGIILGITDVNQLYFYFNSNYRIGPVGSIPINTLTHVALARVSGNTRAFINGTQVGSTYVDSNNYGTRPFRIGADPNGLYAFAGYIDEIRVSKGVGRYSTNFTPATSAFTGDNSTVLLLHLNGTTGSTTFLDDGVTLQDLRTSSGGTASIIDFADYSDFGAEIRSIASACVYGEYGAYGDGQGVIAYLIGHNFAYIGTGKLSSNDPTDVIQANEVYETNDAHIYYTSVDHQGDFRVGDLFHIDQRNGNVTFSAETFNISSLTGVTFTDGVNQTVIDATKIETGNLRLTGNTVSSITDEINVQAANNQVNVNSNLTVDGDTEITGNFTVNGNVTIGDASTDSVTFNARFSSDLIPRVTGVYNLGSSSLNWEDAYASKVVIDDLEITGNLIRTTVSNANIELRANGTGAIVVEDLSINENEIRTLGTNQDLILTPNGTGAVRINSNQSLVIPSGTIAERPVSPETGMIRFNEDENIYEGYNGTYWLQLGGIASVDRKTRITPELTVGANDNVIRFYTNNYLAATLDSTAMSVNSLVVDDLTINNNTIRSTATNADIELDANGTGAVVINDFRITNNTITNSAGTVSELISTGSGYFKIAGTNGVVIPTGTSGTRPGYAVIGMIRYNTELGLTEIWDGLQWSSVAGSSGAINVLQAEEIAIQGALILG